MKISIVVPCYNEEKALPLFYQEINKVSKTLPNYTFQLLFIDDGSTDDTLNVLKNFSINDNRVEYISLSKNFGKESAMYAGLCNSDGDYTAIMDADLQDPPHLLNQMIETLEQGEYDCVATRRSNRKGEGKIKSFFAKTFYKIMNAISNVNMVDGARDFRLMSRKMVNSIIKMSESNRFSKGLFAWVGFKTFWISYENVKRVAGKTKWNFFKLFSYSIEGITNFSDAPLKIASFMGFLFTIVSLIMLLVVFIKALIYGNAVAGWPSTICIILFIGGVQLLCLGIIGQYISKIFIETKKRPHYIISQTNKKENLIEK